MIGVPQELPREADVLRNLAANLGRFDAKRNATDLRISAVAAERDMVASFQRGMEPLARQQQASDMQLTIYARQRLAPAMARVVTAIKQVQEKVTTLGQQTMGTGPATDPPAASGGGAGADARGRVRVPRAVHEPVDALPAAVLEQGNHLRQLGRVLAEPRAIKRRSAASSGFFSSDSGCRVTAARISWKASLPASPAAAACGAASRSARSPPPPGLPASAAFFVVNDMTSSSCVAGILGHSERSEECLGLLPVRTAIKITFSCRSSVVVGGRIWLMNVALRWTIGSHCVGNRWLTCAKPLAWLLPWP